MVDLPIYEISQLQSKSLSIGSISASTNPCCTSYSLAAKSSSCSNTSKAIPSNFQFCLYGRLNKNASCSSNLIVHLVNCPLNSR